MNQQIIQHLEKSLAVEMPVKMRQLRRWRGLPVPFTTFIGRDGNPDFKVVAIDKVNTCLIQRLCGMCGQKLKKPPFALIGGPLSVENNIYRDPPMHPVCAEYAAKVCPYLCNADACYSQAQPKHLKSGDIFVTYGDVFVTYGDVSPIRPDQMAIVYIVDYTYKTSKDLISLSTKATQVLKVDWDQMPKKEKP